MYLLCAMINDDICRRVYNRENHNNLHVMLVGQFNQPWHVQKYSDDECILYKNFIELYDC